MDFTFKDFILIIFFSVFKIGLGQFYRQAYTCDLIDGYSTTSCFLYATKGDDTLWNATGFFFKTDRKTFFLTNNHVVGGTFYIDEYVSTKFLRPTLFPDSLKVRLYDTVYEKSYLLSIPLKKNNKQNWIDFYEYESSKEEMLDVVAIDVTSLVNRHKAGTSILNKSKMREELRLYPGEDLYIVGFPYEYGFEKLYPFWKKGTISSDPIDASSKIYIDATIRPGMSGSPAFFRGFMLYKGNEKFKKARMQTFLIGIYSAQLAGSEIGEIIKIETIYKKLNRL